MRSFRCIQISGIIARRASGLSESERLRLEEHLAICDNCSSDANALSTISQIIRRIESPILPSARGRIIQHALLSMGQKSERPIVKRVYALIAVPIFACVATAIWILLVHPGVELESTPTLVAERTDNSLRDSVLLGEVIAKNRIISIGDKIDSNIDLVSKNISSVVLGRATVELRKNTSIQWHRETSTINLLEGSLLVEVKPQNNKGFRISVKDFIVEVIGTRFEVDLSSVKIMRGKLRILSPREETELTVLEAPGYWEVEPDPVYADEKSQSIKIPTQPKRKPDRLSARSLLAKARLQLADGNAAQARQTITRAISSTTNKPTLAEARSLQAECALVEGKLARAIDSYRAVAMQYPDLPAAENALFAAAQLELRRGKKSAAKALLEHYMQRYPNGRFKNEVLSRLNSLINP